MEIGRQLSWHTFCTSLLRLFCRGNERFFRRCVISEYSVVQAEYTDPECIKAALKEMGYVFEEHTTAQNLHGFQGDVRTQKANIIIRRKNVGSASNDVGFNKTASGKYELIISQYDKGGKTGTNFMERMRQLYSKHKTVKQLKKMGKTVTSIKQGSDGKIKIKALG